MSGLHVDFSVKIYFQWNITSKFLPIVSCTGDENEAEIDDDDYNLQGWWCKIIACAVGRCVIKAVFINTYSKSRQVLCIALQSELLAWKFLPGSAMPCHASSKNAIVFPNSTQAFKGIPINGVISNDLIHLKDRLVGLFSMMVIEAVTHLLRSCYAVLNKSKLILILFCFVSLPSIE